MYFENGGEMPSPRPEMELTGNQPPSPLAPGARLAGCLELAAKLAARVDGMESTPMSVSRCEYGLHLRTRLVFGHGGVATAGDKVGAMLGRFGFHSVPSGFRVIVVAAEPRDARVVRYCREIGSALTRCGVNRPPVAISFARLRNELVKEVSAIDKLPPANALLIAVSGHQGVPLSADVLDLLALLDGKGRSYRLFSLDNPSMAWSAFDQIGSVLQSAGGKPFVLDLPWPEGVDKSFLLGVDVGHPLDSADSWVSFSLTDCHGVHLESWRYLQVRDETISPATLRLGLQWAGNRLRHYGGTSHPSVVVLRDGRLHKGEDVSAYRRALGSNLTFVELSKRQNPEMFMSASTPKPVSAGTACWPLPGSVAFIAPVAPRLRNDLARVFKVHMKPAWDGLGLDLERLLPILVGLSYSPGLGLQPHALPGPIYWADGIGSIGPCNHQFSGQKSAQG